MSPSSSPPPPPPPPPIDPSQSQPHPHPLQDYTTPLHDHAYSTLSPLNTLDVHLPTTPPSTRPFYTLVYIHGGAFRDPLTTSASIVPSLPNLFPPLHRHEQQDQEDQEDQEQQQHQYQQKHHLAAVISLNYRLAPYPNHPTDPAPSSRKNKKWNNNQEERRKSNENHVYDRDHSIATSKDIEEPILAQDANENGHERDHEDEDDSTHNDSSSTGRNAHWPDPLHDIQAALTYLGSDEFEHALRVAVEKSQSTNKTTNATSPSPSLDLDLSPGGAWILAGHSVGATMAMMMALTPTPELDPKLELELELELNLGTPATSASSTSAAPAAPAPASTTLEKTMSGLRGILLLNGVYDFLTLRNEHLSHKELYEPWIEEVFGPEDDERGKCWDRGNVLKYLQRHDDDDDEEDDDANNGEKERARARASGKAKIRSSIRHILIAHSLADEAVEWTQSETLLEALLLSTSRSKSKKETNKEQEQYEHTCKCEMIEVHGKHDEIVDLGVEIPRCLDLLIQRLISSSSSSSSIADLI